MPSSPAVLARLFGVAVALLATVAVAHPAQAHTGFDYSVPTDGATVGTPLTEVTVAFTLPVTLIGSGFEVFDPQGNVLQPFAVTDDDTIFRLQFDPPLAGGAVGVRYTVTAEDGHSLSGSFSFTVSAPLPAVTVPATDPVTVPATDPVTVPATDPAPVTTLSGTAPSLAPPATSAASSEIAELVVGAGTPSSGPAGDTGDQSNSGLVIGLAAGVAALAALFLAVRARTVRLP